METSNQTEYRKHSSIIKKPSTPKTHYKSIINQIDVQNVVRLCQRNSKIYWMGKKII